jgi:anti-sigma regulatory factor (Ser/Thr protein kinase)
MSRFTTDIVPDPEAISQLSEQVAGFLREAGVDARATFHVGLVIEEVLMNVASHGGQPVAPASVQVDVEPDRIRGEIRDTGRPFDPRGAAAPDLTAPAEQRAIGGLGLHLVRQLSSVLDYRREGQQNWTMFCIPRNKDN